MLIVPKSSLTRLLWIFILSFVSKLTFAMDTKLCITVDLDTNDPAVYSNNLIDENNNTPKVIGKLTSTFEQCWKVILGTCYTYNVSITNSNKLNSISVKASGRKVGLFTNNLNEVENNFIKHFCISPDLHVELAPFPFVRYTSFGKTQQSNDKNKIYHRQTEVYTKLHINSDVCNGFKATQMYDDNLSLQLADNDKSCDEIINFKSQYGYCECFGGKIMINVLEKENDSCFNICNALNVGCSQRIPDAIFNPDAVVGCNTMIENGIPSAIAACADGWHICESAQELDYLHLTNYMCRILSPVDTFYSSQDTTECGDHQNNANLLMGCGNKQNNKNLPILPSFCDIFTYALVSFEAIMNSQQQVTNETVWYTSQWDEALYTSIRKVSESEGGVMCCIDNVYTSDDTITWTKWELILLAVAHAIFVVIFILTFLVMCERIFRHVCIRIIIKRYRKWQQKKRLNHCVKHGLFKRYSDTIKDKKCAICLDEYNQDDKIMILNCGHHYHSECGRTWLLEHDSCPLCLQPISDGKDLRNCVILDEFHDEQTSQSQSFSMNEIEMERINPRDL